MGFNDLLNASFKSKDTEEWLDVHFTRPIGLLIALLCKHLKIHPNYITIVSIFLGIAAGISFSFSDLSHNIFGVLLLMLANFCDSADGQLARIANQKTMIGRMLDGFAGDLWFLAIYVCLALRMTNQLIPGTSAHWGIGIWIIALISGFLCHSPQSSLADYYRQIHLFFLKGKEGSELDTYTSQWRIFKSLPKKGALLQQIFYFNYANYCKSQEHRTPAFQKLILALQNKYGNVARFPLHLKDSFLNSSRPLMKYTNILTFNFRALCLYVTCLLDCPWVYMLIEITVLNVIYVYMHKKHEALCKRLLSSMTDNQ
ncbi:MAG: CDP-alcohol phosphatidyltransferase family protein [Prevotella sp.]|nr:CDP-alcohol phosphatidyltransferase family protein [Prevotella sp.]